MSTKKALIVTALSGFVRSFLINDIEMLQAKGYEVHCASNSNHPGNEGICNFFDEKKIVFHQIDFSSNSPLSIQTFIARKQLKKLSKEIKFDFVHCHTPIAAAICRSVFKKQWKKGLKIFYTTHGFPFHNKSSKLSWLLFWPIENYYSKFTNKIITINKEDFLNAKKMRCKDVSYLHGVGVNLEKFSNTKIDLNTKREELQISPDSFVIIAIGELSKRKNHSIIIDAIAQSQIPNAVFLICGNKMNSCSTNDELIELAKEKKVDLRLLGLRSDVNEIIRISNVGVLPSLREGLGLSGIEILSEHVPLIGSDVQGIKDYIKNGVNGYLCNPLDSSDFGEKLLLIYNGQFHFHEVPLTKFGIEETKKELEVLYKEL